MSRINLKIENRKQKSKICSRILHFCFQPYEFKAHSDIRSFGYKLAAFYFCNSLRCSYPYDYTLWMYRDRGEKTFFLLDQNHLVTSLNYLELKTLTGLISNKFLGPKKNRLKNEIFITLPKKNGFQRRVFFKSKSNNFNIQFSSHSPDVWNLWFKSGLRKWIPSEHRKKLDVKSQMNAHLSLPFHSLTFN